MKVVIIHDWLIGGGAEKVVLELHKMYPEAPIYTSVATREWRERLDGKVVTGYLQKWPFPKLRKFTPLLRARWFKSLDLTGFDLIISSKGNGEASYIRKPDRALHICYCHSPTHFYWRKYDEYIREPGFGFLNPVARLGLKLLVRPLRNMDYAAAQKVDYFIANSTNIQQEIKKSYNRDSTVIHPPVDVDRFSSIEGTQQRTGFVTVGRQVPYKRTDIIVRACSELNLPLAVIGRGPEHDKLIALAGPSVTFVTDATDEDVAKAMAHAQAFIFAADEDFGITPVEAMAAGTPIIAYKAGGALDYVIAGKTGLFFNEQTIESLAAAIQSFQHTKYSEDIIRSKASEFSPENFQQNFSASLAKILA